ncbi:hypothetical protein ACFL3G_06975 [Planctomycetota bacterium]
MLDRSKDNDRIDFDADLLGDDSGDDDTVAIPIESIEPAKRLPKPIKKTDGIAKVINHQIGPAEKADVSAGGEQKVSIPQFDLAEQIMAEHRKSTATKRKSPGQKSEAKEPAIRIKEFSVPAKKQINQPSQPDRIIADIVARDIAKLS